MYSLFSLGYLLVAVSLLPISRNSKESTLIYGSCDGGENMFYDETIAEKIENLANYLNLSKHVVNGKEMALCGDIECHVGIDKRFFLFTNCSSYLYLFCFDSRFNSFFPTFFTRVFVFLT